MSLLTVVKDVCATVGVEVPTSVFTNISSNRTMQEMVALATEMAQRIAYDSGNDWTMLRAYGQFVGLDPLVTSTDDYLLPLNYKRMLLTTNVRIVGNATTPLRFVPDLDQWVERRMLNRTDGAGEWTINGGKMLIEPLPALGVTIIYTYLDKNCVTLASGGVGDAFVADGDSFRLSERLLKLGMIWQWKANKGTAYSEDMGTYGDALSMEIGKDNPKPILMDRPTIRQGWADASYGW